MVDFELAGVVLEDKVVGESAVAACGGRLGGRGGGRSRGREVEVVGADEDGGVEGGVRGEGRSGVHLGG